MAKNQNIKSVTPLFLFISTLIVGFIYQINKDNLQDIRSLAYTEEESQRYCTNPPACCAAISKTHDAHECEWPIRGFCNNCGDVEGPNERCGWYWIFHGGYTDTDRGYGCVIGKEGNTRPIYNADGTTNFVLTPTPTVPVSPTAIPTPLPTSVPTDIPQPTLPPPPPAQIVLPTQPRPQITYVPVVIPPYTPPTVTPTPTPFKINLPNILPPKEKVDSFFTAVKTNLLDFFSKILP